MSVNEEKLSKDAKSVLAILRAEMAAHRITPEAMKFLEKAVKTYDAFGVIGGFALKVAAWIAAISGGYLAIKGLFR